MPSEYPMPSEDKGTFNIVGMNYCMTITFQLAILDSISYAKTRARLFSVFSSESGAWLGALPAPSLGTKLDNESLRIAQ